MSEPIQIHKPAPLIVAQCSSGATWTAFTSTANVAEFVVPIPDPRLRTRVTLLQYETLPNGGGYRAQAGSYGQIYLATREKDRLGRINGMSLPLVNIVGTSTAGEVFPASSDVSGGSWTWDGPGDEIYGKLSNFITLANNNGTRWQLQVTYTPMVRLCPVEWNEVIQKGVPWIIQPVEQAMGTTS